MQFCLGCLPPTSAVENNRNAVAAAACGSVCTSMSRPLGKHMLRFFDAAAACGCVSAASSMSVHYRNCSPVNFPEF